MFSLYSPGILGVVFTPSVIAGDGSGEELGVKMESSRTLFTLPELQLQDSDLVSNQTKQHVGDAHEPGLHRKSESHQEARESPRSESGRSDQITPIDTEQGADQ